MIQKINDKQKVTFEIRMLVLSTEYESMYLENMRIQNYKWVCPLFIRFRIYSICLLHYV